MRKPKIWIGLATIGFFFFLFSELNLANAAEPLSPQELEHFQKYVGKWGGASWSVPGSSGRTKRGNLEIVIGEIDPATRKAKITYSSTGGVGSEETQATYTGTCEKDKIVFETPNHRIEFQFKAGSLWGTRTGKHPGTTTLKKLD